ncbi:hypothetical protein BC834DRAFT_457589 [Gloeopeniophorella convolvens]|nr:hypothetical protein BC834DRAFT_457589 [Gloeopeniophorella convolvens]
MAKQDLMNSLRATPSHGVSLRLTRALGFGLLAATTLSHARPSWEKWQFSGWSLGCQSQSTANRTIYSVPSVKDNLQRFPISRHLILKPLKHPQAPLCSAATEMSCLRKLPLRPSAILYVAPRPAISLASRLTSDSHARDVFERKFPRWTHLLPGASSTSNRPRQFSTTSRRSRDVLISQNESKITKKKMQPSCLRSFATTSERPLSPLPLPECSSRPRPTDRHSHLH